MKENDKKPGKEAGGLARAKSLSSLQRSGIARKGAAARWETAPIATHGSEENPLVIGEIKIPCYVLSDRKRVLVQHNMAAAIGLSGTGGSRITRFIRGNQIEEFINDSLIEAIENPIKFRLPKGGTANGYDANILVDLCEAVLSARDAGKLLKNQEIIAKQCEVLIRGLARVGIIALIDEVTGYQKDRAANDLAKILEAFIIKELQPWVSTFPVDFYENLFRLRNLVFVKDSVKRPQYFGLLTTDIIYKRLAPGVRDELDDLAKSHQKMSKPKLFQFLTKFGYNKLKEHIGAVIAVMKLSSDYRDFIEKMNKHYPVMALNADYPEYSMEEDSGDGI